MQVEYTAFIKPGTLVLPLKTPVTRKKPQTTDNSDRQLIKGVLLGERGRSREWFPNALCFLWTNDAGQEAC